MLTKTSLIAIKALMTIALDQDHRPRTPGQLAKQLGASPTYLGKILGMLVKGGVLSSIRGARGGVLLRRKPELITLLDVYAATQGPLTPDFCDDPLDSKRGCAFHVAMVQLHEQLVSALSRWTLADLIAHPAGRPGGTCRMLLPQGAPSRSAASR